MTETASRLLSSIKNKLREKSGPAVTSMIAKMPSMRLLLLRDLCFSQCKIKDRGKEFTHMMQYGLRDGPMQPNNTVEVPDLRGPPPGQPIQPLNQPFVLPNKTRRRPASQSKDPKISHYPPNKTQIMPQTFAERVYSMQQSERDDVGM